MAPQFVILSEVEGSPADCMRSLRYGRDDRVTRSREHRVKRSREHRAERGRDHRLKRDDGVSRAGMTNYSDLGTKP